MLDIIPSILAHSEEEFREKIEQVRPLRKMVHIDIMDGEFVNNTTWAPPDLFPDILEGIPFEAHVMMNEPEHNAVVWASTGASRVLFHVETTTRSKLLLRASRHNSLGSPMGVALNPDTPASVLVELLPNLSHVLLMSVQPGWSGQEFQPHILEKIKEVRKMGEKLNIIVDGGVNFHNIPAIDKAGANAVVVGSVLTDSPDPLASLTALEHTIKLA